MFIWIVVWTLLLLGCNPFADSPYANCIVVEDEQHFNGAFLKHTQAKLRGPKKTEECVALDNTIDKGDGPKRGKVRWIVCSMGPDCDEAGLH